MRRLFGFFYGGRRAIATVPITIIALVALWQVARWRYYRGYTVASRTGIVRKVGVSGPPYCKFTSIELMANNNVAVGQPEIWQFSADDENPDGPVMKALHEAERTGAKITVDYRRDLHKWWACSPSEYFITAVEK